MNHLGLKSSHSTKMVRMSITNMTTANVQLPQSQKSLKVVILISGIHKLYFGDQASNPRNCRRFVKARPQTAEGL